MGYFNMKRLRAIGAGVGLTALTIVCAPAQAAPLFTLNPGAIGASGGTVTADTLVLTDFATINFSAPSGNNVGFTEAGTLGVIGFERGASPLVNTGINQSFGMYFSFSGAGTQTNVDALTANGNFTSLNFSLYAYVPNGPVSYAPTNTTPGGVVNPVLVASGTLRSGTTGVSGGSPNANAQTTFTTVNNGFFADPRPFYNTAFSAFINTSGPNQVSGSLASGFVITNGGGSANFTNVAVPEPISLALFGTGLAVLGLARARRLDV